VGQNLLIVCPPENNVIPSDDKETDRWQFAAEDTNCWFICSHISTLLKGSLGPLHV